MQHAKAVLPRALVELADRFGAMPILYFGLTVYVIGCLLGFFVHDIYALTLSRMFMALGTALISPSTQALIRLQVPGNKLTFAFGIYGTTMSGAAAFGPWVSGLIASQQHWSWVFAINLPLALVAAIFIFFSIICSNFHKPDVYKFALFIDPF